MGCCARPKHLPGPDWALQVSRRYDVKVLVEDKGNAPYIHMPCPLSFAEVGQRGKRAETVGREAGKRLAVDLLAGSVVDHHSQDQIVVFMALASGKSRVRVGSVTEHTLAAMRVAEAVLAVNFEIEGDEGDVVLSCEGVGLLAPSEPATDSRPST